MIAGSCCEPPPPRYCLPRHGPPRAHVPVPARVLLTAARDTLATLDADAAGYFSAVICRRAVIIAHFRRPGYRPDSLVITLDSARQAPLDVAMTRRPP